MKAPLTALLIVIVTLLCSSCAVAQIPEQTMWEQKVCDGSARTFTFSFTIQAATDIAVWTVDTTTTPYTADELTSGTEYTLSVYNGRYPATGGTVVTTTAYPSTTALVITTDIDLTQSGALSAVAWNPIAVQYMINKSRLIDNEQDRRLGQTIHNPPTISPSVSGELPEAGRAGYIYRDATGAPSLASGIDADPNLERLGTNTLIQWLADLTNPNTLQGLAALDPNAAGGTYYVIPIWSTITGEWDEYFISSVGSSLVDAASEAAAREAISVVPGTDVQTQDPQLQAIAALTPDVNQVIVFTGATSAEVRDFSDFDPNDLVTFNANLAVKNGTTSPGKAEFYEDADGGDSHMDVYAQALSANREAGIPDVTGTFKIISKQVHDFGGGSATWALTDGESVAGYFGLYNASGPADVTFPINAPDGHIFTVYNSSGQTITIKVAGATGDTAANGKYSTWVHDGDDCIKIYEQP